MYQVRSFQAFKPYLLCSALEYRLNNIFAKLQQNTLYMPAHSIYWAYPWGQEAYRRQKNNRSIVIFRLKHQQALYILKVLYRLYCSSTFKYFTTSTPSRQWLSSSSTGTDLYAVIATTPIWLMVAIVPPSLDTAGTLWFNL